MAKTSRTKEIWHIPKRGNVHQTIYMVYLLTLEKFSGKTWSSGKQEMLGSEMGKAGLTESGKAITHQSVRTLLANLPKYLGFVYIDEESTPSRILVTAVGNELIKEHNINKISKHKKIAEYSRAHDLIEISETFRKQMAKLIITNPIILKDCNNILVFPFRMTLRLLLELNYLDVEEIAYFLFHTKNEDEFSLLIQKIKTFRSLPLERRSAEIAAYKKTEEGKLTLVKAPTSGYYAYLCYSTGLCDRISVKVNKLNNQKLAAITLKNKSLVIKLLDEFKDAKIYDFKNDKILWNEYFSNPIRLSPPINIEIKTTSREEIIIAVHKENRLIGGNNLTVQNSFVIPCFINEKYDLVAYNLEGREIYKKELKFIKETQNFIINLNEYKSPPKVTKEKIINQIVEMFSKKFKGFDKEYSSKLKVVEKITGHNYLDNRRMGGRLEYLFFDLLNILKKEGIIDNVFWYGKMGRYGISEPAPGGKEGNPDIVFEVNNYLFILELTTIKGVRAQWNSSEASSVPDHISKFMKLNSSKNVIGIFSAPSIHHQLEQNLKLNAKKENVGMIFKPCIEFAKLLGHSSKKDLLKNLVNESKKQLSE